MVRANLDRLLSARPSLVIAGLCVVAALFPAASGGYARAPSCGPAGAQTLAADHVARVYRVTTGPGELGTVYNYYGCTAGSDKSRLLVASANSLPGARVYGCAGSGCRLVRAIHLVGAAVGFIVEDHGLDTVSTALSVRDLADGHVLHSVRANTVVGYGERLTTYVLAPSGNIAWATVTTSRGTDGTVRRAATIHRAIGQRVLTLDSGPGVRALSLRLRGDTVEWIDRGGRQTASLP